MFFWKAALLTLTTTEYLVGPISSVTLTAHPKDTGLTVQEPLVQPHRNEEPAFHGRLGRITREYYASLGRCLDLRAS